MELRPVARASVADGVYDQLATTIVGGGIAVGDAIPSERELAAALGVSRPVVREALKRLAHAGLVRIRHGGPTVVRDFHRSAGPDLLGVLLFDRNGELDLTVARSIVEARSELGPPVAAAAARRAAEADVAELAALVDEMRRTGDVRVLQRLAMGFWDRLVDASGNVVHRLLFNALRRAYEPVMDALATVMRAEVSDIEGYAAVVTALDERDPDAAAAAVRMIVDRGARAALDVLDRLLSDAEPTSDPEPTSDLEESTHG